MTLNKILPLALLVLLLFHYTRVIMQNVSYWRCSETVWNFDMKLNSSCKQLWKVVRVSLKYFRLVKAAFFNKNYYGNCPNSISHNLGVRQERKAIGQTESTGKECSTADRCGRELNWANNRFSSWLARLRIWKKWYSFKTGLG